MQNPVNAIEQYRYCKWNALISIFLFWSKILGALDFMVLMNCSMSASSWGDFIIGKRNRCLHWKFLYYTIISISILYTMATRHNTVWGCMKKCGNAQPGASRLIWGEPEQKPSCFYQWSVQGCSRLSFVHTDSGNVSTKFLISDP